MSYGEGIKGNNLYPGTSALITPPKDPKEQHLIASSHVHNHGPSRGNLLTPSYRTDEPFSPIIDSSAKHGEFEPLPYTCDIFEGSFSPSNNLKNNLWRLVYSPLQATTPRADKTEHETEDGEQKQFDGNLPSLPALDEVLSGSGNSCSKSKNPRDNISNSQLSKNDNVDKAHPHPHNHWPMYHPPTHPAPYYWYPHGRHYGYPHHYDAQDDQRNNRRLSHSSLYPKPNGHFHQYAYPPPMHYGPYGKPPFMGNHPQPEVSQEYIMNVTNNDVICGRGGAVNNHPGNRRFRQFIQDFKHQYLNESKQKKPFVAMRVLEAVKNSNPPGRFLVKYPGGYLECGDDRAREKASQALREGAAKLRKQGYGVKSYASETSMVGDEAPQKRELPVIEKIMLPNERAYDESFCDDSQYSSVFDPPRKKIKQEEV